MYQKILIVDDDETVAQSLETLLEAKGYQVCVVTDPTKAMAVLQQERIGVALVDLRMPGIGGIELLQSIKSRHPDLPVFIVTGHATVDSAVAAMKYGATDIFTKPVKAAHLISEIDRMLRNRPSEMPACPDDEIVARDPQMLECLQVFQRAAPTDVPVLITGESGTGKELAARMIHRHSVRRNGPMVAINCAAVPDALLESEMFGHEKGAFTDAHERKPGLFELARSGTIFLDEIGEMSLKTQAKMLRVLQEKKFTPIGGIKTIDADCRIVAATNRDLQQAIREGAFREDLFYRLSVITVAIPPLRQRPRDIEVLARHFLVSSVCNYQRQTMTFSPDVLSIINSHSWPGNVRELKNFVERAVIFCDGAVINPDNLSPQYRSLQAEVHSQELSEKFASSAREVLVEALQQAKGSKAEAARLLHIDRKTLYNRLKKYGLE